MLQQEECFLTVYITCSVWGYNWKPQGVLKISKSQISNLHIFHKYLKWSMDIRKPERSALITVSNFLKEVSKRRNRINGGSNNKEELLLVFAQASPSASVIKLYSWFDAPDLLLKPTAGRQRDLHKKYWVVVSQPFPMDMPTLRLLINGLSATNHTSYLIGRAPASQISQLWFLKPKHFSSFPIQIWLFSNRK